MRLYSLPKDYSLEEAEALLKGYGFQKHNKGKTSGSRVAYFRENDQKVLLLHAPHKHGNVMDLGAVKDLVRFIKMLEEEGELDV